MQELWDAFREGAEEAGKDPETMPKLVTTSAVVGDQEEAEYAADIWRFSADSWDPDLLYEPDVRELQRKAEEKFALEDVYGNWAYDEDPEEHAQKMQDLLDAGATRVFVQSPQRGQRRFIDFYGSQVLPLLRSS